MRRRTQQEVLDRLGEIETSIAAVELALTRLEFAMARLPAGEELSGYSTLLDSAAAFRDCLAVLLTEHTLMLEDLDRVRRFPGVVDSDTSLSRAVLSPINLG